MGARASVPAVVGFAALAAAASAVPFTPHLDAIEAAVADRQSSLLGLTDPESVARVAALGRLFPLFEVYSPSVSKDIALVRKIAGVLEKRFPPDDPVVVALDGALDGLEGEIGNPRAVLVVEIGLLSGAKAANAAKGLAAADALLVRADLAGTRRERATLLGRALRKVLSTRRALRGGGVPGFQGPRNPSFEDADPFAVFPDSDSVQIRNASNSFVGYLDEWVTTGGTVARTGIGATHGVVKGGVGASYNINGGFVQGNLFQDGVNLSRSRRLVFDWEITGNIANPCSTTGVYPYARLEIRFSAPSGSVVTLWRQDVRPNPANGTFSTGIATAVVDLPYLPEPGQLAFTATSASDPCPPPPPAPPGSQPTPGGSSWGYVAYLDNIRAE